MIKLINGRGQMGSVLSRKLKNIKNEEEIFIYHTWNIEDKTYLTQKKEYDKFKNFVLENKESKIIFISTNSQKEGAYVKFKQLSESFLIQNNKKSFVLRFPTIIGKGVFYDFKNNKKTPYGKMNIMSIEEACDLIINKLQYKGDLKIMSFDGHKIKAELVYELVRL